MLIVFIFQWALNRSSVSSLSTSDLPTDRPTTRRWPCSTPEATKVSFSCFFFSPSIEITPKHTHTLIIRGFLVVCRYGGCGWGVRLLLQGHLRWFAPFCQFISGLGTQSIGLVFQGVISSYPQPALVLNHSPIETSSSSSSSLYLFFRKINKTNHSPFLHLNIKKKLTPRSFPTPCLS